MVILQFWCKDAWMTSKKRVLVNGSLDFESRKNVVENIFGTHCGYSGACLGSYLSADANEMFVRSFKCLLRSQTHPTGNFSRLVSGNLGSPNMRLWWFLKFPKKIFLMCWLRKNICYKDKPLKIRRVVLLKIAHLKYRSNRMGGTFSSRPLLPPFGNA